MSGPTSRRVLAAALVALALVYALRFHDDPNRLVAWAVFSLPPLLLLPGAWRGGRLSTFWAGTLALLWFCHGVMEAWAEPAKRGHGLAIVALSLVIVFSVAWPALSSRFGRRKRARE